MGAEFHFGIQKHVEYVDISCLSAMCKHAATSKRLEFNTLNSLLTTFT